MSERFFSLWKKKDLLRQSLDEAYKMMEKAEEMFKFATEVLFEKQSEAKDIYIQDQLINRYEIDIRRKILEHLSINPREDITSSLILTSVVIDIERIGDFSKNIIELARIYPERLTGRKYVPEILKLREKVDELFNLTKKSFREEDIEKGKIVMGQHARIAKECDSMLERLIKDERRRDKQAIACDRAIVCALAARYLKRVSAHLKNVASSVVNPFQRLGFKPQE